MTAILAVHHRHTASLLHPTGRHAAHGRVLLARWARHALRVVLHLARRYRPRHLLREAFGADVASAHRLSTMGFPVFTGVLTPVDLGLLSADTVILPISGDEWAAPELFEAVTADA